MHGRQHEEVVGLKSVFFWIFGVSFPQSTSGIEESVPVGQPFHPFSANIRYMRSRVEKRDGATIYSPPRTHEIARSLFQLLSAVSFLHQNEVAHRDIKPDAGCGQLRYHVDPCWSFCQRMLF